MTDAERTLWERLRKKQILGYSFRRQQPLGRYIVDFVCLEKRLIIEVDSGQHLELQREDDERKQWLEQQGYKVLRFWNNEVLTEINSVLEAIVTPLDGQTERRQSRQSPPPCPATASGGGDSAHAFQSPVPGETRCPRRKRCRTIYTIRWT